MDTTKQYILMCEKANEIQELHTNNNLETGNVYVSKYYFDYKVLNYKDIAEVYYDDGYNCGDRNYRYYCWLPRQDQLQEMIKLKSLRQSYINFDFFLGLDRADHRDVMSRYGLNTMEQLWLAFVMKEKYNKIWNGTDWEKEIK